MTKNTFLAAAELDTSLNNSPHRQFFALSTTGTINGAFYQSANDAVVLYADPGTVPNCAVASAAGPSDTPSFYCSISGYLVPAD